MHILNAIDVAKKRWQPDSDSFFSFYIYVLGSNIIMCKVRFNIGVKSVI